MWRNFPSFSYFFRILWMLSLKSFITSSKKIVLFCCALFFIDKKIYRRYPLLDPNWFCEYFWCWNFQLCLTEVVCTRRNSISEGQNHGCTPALGTDRRCSGMLKCILKLYIYMIKHTPFIIDDLKIYGEVRSQYFQRFKLMNS